MATIGTDYADFGFIHCIDEDADLDRIMNGGIWDYAQARHADGTIRHLAFSTHNPHIARRPPPGVSPMAGGVPSLSLRTQKI